MNFSAGLLPQMVYWTALGAFLLLSAGAVYLAPWQIFRKEPQKVHVFLGACVALLLLWQMEAGLRPGLSYHLLGATLFVLMFGWQLAFVGLALVVLGSTINGMGDWYSLPLNTLVMAGIPVAVSYGVYRFAVRFLPHHFIVYILGNAFFCGGLAMISTIAASAALLTCCGPYSTHKVIDEYLPFAPLMVFAEAFFTGMIASSLVLFRPEWVSTFDDRRYLSGK